MTDRRDEIDDAGPDMTAGELALGLLEADERAAAMRRMLSDRGFAADVERWRQLLAPLIEAWPEQAPPDGLFGRVEASVAGGEATPRRGWLWPVATALAGIAAAVLLVLYLARPAPPVPMAATAPAPLLAAAIQPTAAGAPAVVALYDPVRASIRVGASPVRDAGHSAELWVIADAAPPRPLGLLADAASSLALPVPVRGVMTAGSTLAISREPAGGSPTGLPTGPVIATGKLQPV